MKRIFVTILKHLRMLGVARRVWLRWRAIQPWGEPPRHRRAMMALYSRFVGEGDLCFDIGANMGERTEAFVRLGATVVAVEPQDVCVQRLRGRYGNSSRVAIVQKALGEEEGQAEMMLSDAHGLSSLSRGWVESVKASGRLSQYRWDRSVMVAVTTLDKLIEQYGQPVLCKIDVEGFEFEVLKGLSQPIKVISLEYSPDFLDPAIRSVRRLSSMGMHWFNYSVGESMRLSLEEWVGSETMCDILSDMPDKSTYGDVYATCDPELAHFAPDGPSDQER